MRTTTLPLLLVLGWMGGGASAQLALSQSPAFKAMASRVTKLETNPSVDTIAAGKAGAASARLEVVKTDQPLDYAGTRASMIVQHKDAAYTKGVVPSVAFDLRDTGNGDVTPGTESSNAINQGVVAHLWKYGDGSLQGFTVDAELHATGAKGYNELGLLQFGATNQGSTLGYISGLEGYISDSPGYDGALHYSTRMVGAVTRILKFDPTNRLSTNFMASSEGTQPVDAVLLMNPKLPAGLNRYKRGIDLTGANFATGNAVIIPNNTAYAAITAEGVTGGIMGVQPDDTTYVRTLGTATKLTNPDSTKYLMVDFNAGPTRLSGASLLNLTEIAQSAVPTPPSGTQTLFIDSTSHRLSMMNSAGTVTAF